MVKISRYNFSIFGRVAALIAACVVSAAASVTLIADGSSKMGVAEGKRSEINRILQNDPLVSALNRSVGAKFQVVSQGGTYTVQSQSLPSDTHTAALYWVLKQKYPAMAALSDSADSVVPPVAGKGTSQGANETLRLWLALFALAIVGVLALFVSSLQLRKLQKKYWEMEKNNEEIEKRLSGFFSTMSEEIFSKSKEASRELDRIMHDVPQVKNDRNIEKVIELENQILDNSMNLLNFLKLKAKKITVKNEPFDINNLLDDVLGSLKSELSQVHSELIFEIEKEVPRHLIGDFSHLSEILRNLLEHALLHNVGEDVRLQIGAYRPYSGDSELQFRIYFDTVCENEPDPDEFFVPVRDENSGEYRRLGLFVARELVKLSGGHLGVYCGRKRSERIFDLTLNLEAANKNEARKYHLPDHRMIEKNILIVNQSFDASLGIKRAFAYFRHKVDILDVETFERKRPRFEKYDLVLIDEGLIDEALLDHFHSLRQKRYLKVVALHNIFTPPRTFKPGIISKTLNKPVTQLAAFTLIVELFSPGASETEHEIPSEGRSQTPETETKRPFITDYPPHPGTSLSDFARFGGHTLLVAEDNPINYKMLERILAASGMEIIHAQNGQEAVETMKRSKPGSVDLILMDINMPVMDGYEATQEIRQLPSGQDLPIVALSALNLENEIKRMQSAGLDGYLPKPLDLGKLYSAFERHLPLQKTKTARNKQEVPELTLIDLEKAKERANGNEVLMYEIFESFLDVYGDSDHKLRQLAMEGDYDAMRAMLLDILGISGTIASERFYQRVKELYKVLLLNKLDAVDAALEEYSQTLIALKKELRPYLYAIGHFGDEE